MSNKKPTDKTDCRYRDTTNQECEWMENEFYPDWMELDTPVVEADTCNECSVYAPPRKAQST